MEKQWKQWETLFSWASKSLQMVTAAMKWRLLLGRKPNANLDSILKSRDIILPTKVGLVKAMVFPVVIHVWVWELDHKEIWVPDNWCFWTVVLEKTLESPLDCKEIQPVDPKGNQSWIFIGRTDAEADTPILWPPDAKKRLWCWERLKAREGDNRGWDGWMASPTWWIWVWASFGSWWWTGKPGMLQFMGSQRVGCDWTTELKITTHKFNWGRKRKAHKKPHWNKMR